MPPSGLGTVDWEGSGTQPVSCSASCYQIGDCPRCVSTAAHHTAWPPRLRLVPAPPSLSGSSTHLCNSTWGQEQVEQGRDSEKPQNSSDDGPIARNPDVKILLLSSLGVHSEHQQPCRNFLRQTDLRIAPPCRHHQSITVLTPTGTQPRADITMAHRARSTYSPGVSFSLEVDTPSLLHLGTLLCWGVWL